jgi:hypothetical protein
MGLVGSPMDGNSKSWLFGFEPSSTFVRNILKPIEIALVVASSKVGRRILSVDDDRNKCKEWKRLEEVYGAIATEC